MTFDFNDSTTMLKVKEAISDLLFKLNDAKNRIYETRVKNMDSIFKQFIEEAVAYRNTSQYKLLKAYETECAHKNFFSNFNFEFFQLLQNSNRTIGDFEKIMTAIGRISSQLYWESSYISENYL